MWQLFGGPPQARAAGRDIGGGVVVLDVDSAIVIVHSDKDGAAPTYKHTYGFHPILVTCDNTGELDGYTAIRRTVPFDRSGWPGRASCRSQMTGGPAVRCRR